MEFDKRNFSRKALAMEWLIKMKDKEKQSSKKGAFYYRVNKRKYKSQFQSLLNTDHEK